MLSKPSLELMASYPSQGLFPGFFRRIVAAAIDFLLIGLVWFAVGLNINILPTWSGDTVTFYAKDFSKIFIVFICFLAYFTLLEGTVGWTLGKIIFQEEVVTLRGRRANLVQALIRNAFKPVDILLLLSPLLLSPKNQTLGDRYARTLVISRNAGVPGIISEDRYIFTFKKIVGVFLLIVSLASLTVGFYFLNNYLPEINAANKATLVYFMRLEKGFELNNNFRAAYETASSKVREKETLEEYQQRLTENPLLPLALQKWNEMSFYKWQFTEEEDKAVIYGVLDDQYTLEIELHKEQNQWKFVSANVAVVAP